MTALIWIGIITASLPVYGVGAGIAKYLVPYDECFPQQELGMIFWPIAIPLLLCVKTADVTLRGLEARAKRRAALKAEIPAPKLPEARIVNDYEPIQERMAREASRMTR